MPLPPICTVAVAAVTVSSEATSTSAAAAVPAAVHPRLPIESLVAARHRCRSVQGVAVPDRRCNVPHAGARVQVLVAPPCLHVSCPCTCADAARGQSGCAGRQTDRRVDPRPRVGRKAGREFARARAARPPPPSPHHRQAADKLAATKLARSLPVAMSIAHARPMLHKHRPARAPSAACVARASQAGAVPKAATPPTNVKQVGLTPATKAEAPAAAMKQVRCREKTSYSLRALHSDALNNPIPTAAACAGPWASRPHHHHVRSAHDDHRERGTARAGEGGGREKVHGGVGARDAERWQCDGTPQAHVLVGSFAVRGGRLGSRCDHG